MLIVVSAPSGCGKTTIVDRLLKRHPNWVRSISVTTREPRVGERKGIDYYFVTPEAFEKMQNVGELLESAKVFHHDYGTPKGFVMDRLCGGENVVLAIDVQGMKKIKDALGASVRMLTLFVLPPSIRVLRERLEGRKTDSIETIEERITTAQEEIKDAGFYDYTVMNQNLEQTVLEIEEIVEKVQKNEGGKDKHAVHST